jgi:site-specific recombinase XerC
MRSDQFQGFLAQAPAGQRDGGDILEQADSQASGAIWRTVPEKARKTSIGRKLAALRHFTRTLCARGGSVQPAELIQAPKAENTCEGLSVDDVFALLRET